MAHTLEALKAGELVGEKRLKLALGLKEFPTEIFDLSETLEVLDLSGNDFCELPDNMGDLKKLKIVFFANNKFTEFPKVLADCPELSMIGFKANQIHTIPENAFPPKLRWLILTDNKITKLPVSFGNINLLQKCALAGNLIEELPNEMANCRNLELLRISANKLKVIPDWLFELPKLSWVAFSGNPATYHANLHAELEYYDWSDFEVKELLGEGASGLISKAHWKSQERDVAIKVFKGAVTSDGLPEDEMEVSIKAGEHNSLVEILGKISSHPEGKSGLVMKLIESDFINLGNPPSLETCTRDVFEEGKIFTSKQLLNLARSIASVGKQLHGKGINHGDLYAHNIMVNNDFDSLLGDFGAATFYDRNSNQGALIERVEVRAFGCLIEDVFGLIGQGDIGFNESNRWEYLIKICKAEDVKSRPTFAEVLEIL